MNSHNSEASSFFGADSTSFTDKLKALLPDIALTETNELHAARMAVLEALTIHADDTEVVHPAWVAYRIVCEQLIDAVEEAGSAPHNEGLLWIFVHKALIFREMGDRQGYGQELDAAEQFAFDAKLTAASARLEEELDQLSN